MMCIRKTLSLIGVFCLALYLSACSHPAPFAAIRTGVSNSVDVLPFFVMKEKGFDRALGLRFSEKPYGGGAAILDAMVNNEVDLAPNMGSVPLISFAATGRIPSVVTVVASLSVCDLNHPGTGLVVSKSISSFKQLAGQYIASNSRNSVVAMLIAGRLKREKVFPYTILEIPFPNQGLAVAGGNVAAAPLIEPYLTQSLMRGDGHLLAWLTGEPPFERMAYTVIAFRTAFLKENPGAVKAYLRAHLRSVSWIGKHDREARGILGKTLSINDDVAQKMNLVDWPKDGRNDPKLLLALESEMKDLGLINTIIAPEKLYDETLLDAVLGNAR
jgi:NitT/TauT family transport system substrate-binding protein